VGDEAGEGLAFGEVEGGKVFKKARGLKGDVTVRRSKED